MGTRGLSYLRVPGGSPTYGYQGVLLELPVELLLESFLVSSPAPVVGGRQLLVQLYKEGGVYLSSDGNLLIHNWKFID